MPTHTNLKNEKDANQQQSLFPSELPSFSAPVEKEESFEITIQQFLEIFESFDQNDNILLLDVREDEDMTHGILPKFNRNGVLIHNVRIPILDLIELQTQAIDPYKETHKILVYCRGGKNSVTATRYLQLHGFNAQNIKGGMRSIKEHIDLWENGMFYYFLCVPIC